MPDLLAIAQGFNALRAAGQIAQTMIGLRDSAKLLEKTVELNREIAAVQTALFEAQKEQATLVKTIDELEKEVAHLKAWDADKKRYQMEKLPPGVIVYTLKQDMAEPGELPHSICPTCYHRGKKSPLHSDQPGNGFYNLTCYECGNTLTVGISRRPHRYNTEYDPYAEP
jgi:cell division protein FtsB